MGTGFSKKKKQAKLIQQQLSQIQQKLLKEEATGSAGHGLVTITLTGENEMRQIKINPDCVDPDDVEGLEALIKAAYVDAQQKLSAKAPPLSGLGGNLSSLTDFGI